MRAQGSGDGGGREGGEMNGCRQEQQKGILGSGHAEAFLMALYEKWRE